MATLTSKLIVELVDRATAPSRAVASAINRLTAAQTRNAAALAQAQSKLFGAVAAGYALAKAISAPINAARAFQTKLTDISQKSGVAGTALKDLGDQVRGIAVATNSLPSETLDTFDKLLGLGLGGKTDAENVEAALKLMPAINKAAVAFGAKSEDIMKAGQAAFSNLKVPAENIIRAFDAMAESGNQGAFELKDMAQYFPTLTGSAQLLGMRGATSVADLAAALQVVRQQAGDASEAAANMRDLLNQMLTPRLANNFEKFGINLRKALAIDKKKGLSPIETIISLTKKAMAKGASIGDLFRNRESLSAISALLANEERYRKIRTEARNKSGLVEEEYKKRIKDADAAIIRFQASIENLNIELGRGLLPILTSVIDGGILPLVRAISDVVKKFPMASAVIVSVAAGLIGLQAAAAAAQFAFLWMKGGALIAAAGGLRAIGTAIGIVTSAMRLLKVVMAGSVIGAALLVVAGIGSLIYNNWSGVKEMLSGIWEGFTSALAPVEPALRPVIDGLTWLYDKFTAITGPIDMSKESWRSLGVTIGQELGGAITSVSEKIKTLFGLLSQAGSAIKSGWDAGKAALFPAPAAGARALGGAVRAGSPYLVGERGPELFTPAAAGSIQSTSRTVAALRAAAAASMMAATPAAAGTTNNNSISIVVNAAPGQSAENIATEVERVLSAKLNALSRGAHSDGVY